MREYLLGESWVSSASGASEGVEEGIKGDNFESRIAPSVSLCSTMTSFSTNYVTSEGADSHDILYDPQLSISCYQVSFCAKSYFK